LHAGDVASTPEAEWPRMMCHATEEKESFVEIILGSPVTPGSLIEVRVEKANVRLDDLVAGAVTGTLTDDEKTELLARVEVREELKRLQLDTLCTEW
jgi:hypothetical protein